MIDLISTVATDVTFFEDRARVRRTAVATVKPGVQHLRFEGLSLLVDDSSMLVRIAGVKVLVTRVHRLTQAVRMAKDDEIVQLERDERNTRRTEDAMRAQASRTERQIGRTLAVEQAVLNDIQHVPPMAPEASDWTGAFDAIESRLGEETARRANDKRLVRESEEARLLAVTRLRMGRVEVPEIASYLEVQVEADEARQVEVELEYVVPCALWRPSHVASLNPEDGVVTWQTLATVWQHTGESWKNIQCHFSTARPAQASSPPLLTDDRLRARPKTEEEKRVIQVEARNVEISLAGVGGGGRNVSEMPGVDDGGEPLTLEASNRVTVVSNGEPFRVEINVSTLESEVVRIAIPELTVTPHLRAKARWTGNVPLLAGPVMLMRGTEFTGRTKVAFVGPGDLFELGFGVDSTVSVKRTVEEEHETSRMTGKKTLTRTIKLYLSNLSGGRQKLTARERVPISEIKEVSVKGVTMGAAVDEDGFVNVDFDLPPNATRTHEMTYRIEYSGKVQLSL